MSRPPTSPWRYVLAGDLASPADIAHRYQVSRAAVSQWQKRYADFPAPVAIVAMGTTRLYLMLEVEAWHREWAKGPGRNDS